MSYSTTTMFAAVLFITGIYTAVGFNIYKIPVNTLTNEDPLFGQTIIQSRDGVYVPSPSSGAVFSCTETKCSEMIVTDIKKGLKSITSVASSWSEENEQQFLVCNQVRTTNSSTEYLNGKCTHMPNKQKKSHIYPDKLVSQLLVQNSTNSNNNNNKYQHSQAPLYQDHRRMRRAAQNDEDEDAGTEIAFVLDGSGSIEMEDFEMAKDFIYNVMNNVWKTCFSCNFAIVQYGRNIKTELSLQENNASLSALDKVKNIKQIFEITKTASALYHVLTEVFVPENGSRENAKKMIIVLSDGQISGDPRNLTDVLNMPQMEGIARYAIGVGPLVLNKPKAVKEMIEIAGKEDRFFNVSNYAALTEILSSLEKNIIGIEGYFIEHLINHNPNGEITLTVTSDENGISLVSLGWSVDLGIQKGAGFEFQLAEAGFSAHFTQDGSMLFGAVGAFDWSGGIIVKKNDKDPVTFFNATKEEPRFSYLGYSVASAQEDKKTLYISGAPRYNLTGAVFIFDGINQDLLQGDQVGSYFGSVLCVLDINNDRETDYLLVGAPHFHVKGEEGKVLIYKLNEGRFQKESFELYGLEKNTYARFGSAIADIGDIDGNKFSDVAVGAPLEEDNAGSIYIYNGFQDGIKKHFSQRITPSDFGTKLTHFGRAVSVMSSSERKKLPLISVGSEGAITFFQTIPIIIIQPKINVERENTRASFNISRDEQKNDDSSKFDARLQVCFNTPKGEIKSGNLPIEYQIDLDSHKEQKRLDWVKPQEGRMSFSLTKSETCTNIMFLKYKGCSDCFSPIKIRVNFTLSQTPGVPIRILDAYSPNEAIKEIHFERECDAEQCPAIISLADSKVNSEILTIGSDDPLNIAFNFVNTGYSSYMTTLTLTYPEILTFKKSEGGICDENDKYQIECKLLHPIFKRNIKNSMTITWQPISENSNYTQASITALLTGESNGREVLDSKTYNFTVKKALDIHLTGTANPNRLNITEGEDSKEQLLNFSFKIQGKNKYKAKINATITIKQPKKSDLIISCVKPENCLLFSSDAEDVCRFVCTFTELDEIAITAHIRIHDMLEPTDKIIANGEFTFDKTIYHAKRLTETTQVEVSLIRLTVVKSTALILGSSIGGLLLLIIIIVVLIKCGFFRRRKMDCRD